MQTHAYGEKHLLMPPTRSVVDSGPGPPEPPHMSVTLSGHHQEKFLSSFRLFPWDKFPDVR